MIKIRHAILWLAAILLLAACTPSATIQQITPTLSEAQIATAVIETAGAPVMSTSVFGLAETPQPTVSISAVKTTFPVSTAQQTETSAVAPLQPGATSVIPADCHRANLVGDVTVQNGSVFYPGEKFYKTWRIRNVGVCVWQENYALVLVDGAQLGAPEKVLLNQAVNPGETVDISLKMAAPKTEGDFTSRWKLSDSAGHSFGVGNGGKLPLFLKIHVSGEGEIKPPNLRINFARDYCLIIWQSPASRALCAISGNDFTNGAVYRIMQPVIEGGRQEEETTLVTIPGDGKDGMISGQYPALQIMPGDRFQTHVGCLDKNSWCDVTFRVDVILDGSARQTLGRWTQREDGQWEAIDMDLNSLAGKWAAFILMVENNGFSREDQAFWFVPGVYGANNGGS